MLKLRKQIINDGRNFYILLFKNTSNHTTFLSNTHNLKKFSRYLKKIMVESHQDDFLEAMNKAKDSNKKPTKKRKPKTLKDHS